MEHGHYDPFDDLDETRRSILFILNECNNNEEDLDHSLRRPIQILSKQSGSWTADDLQTIIRATAEMPSGNQPNAHWKHVLHHHQWHDELWNIIDETGYSVLHYLAVSFSTQIIRRGYSPKGFVWIFAKALTAGADLHVLSKGECRDTPLVSLLKSVTCWSFDVSDDLDLVLRGFVQSLADAGVDICHYGKTESDLWSGAFRLLDYNSEPGIRIHGFTHGATIADWSVLVERPGDALAGIFWDMVENHHNIPGSWIDTDALWEDRYFTSRMDRKSSRRSAVLR